MVKISSSAIAEIERIKLSRKIPDICVRLTVQPGGCLDFFYNLELEPLDKMEKQHQSDRIVEVDSIKLAIDTETWKQVESLQLDYAEDLMGGGFRFHNPQVKQTCGCGISFATPTEVK
ncbi:MAG: iron-sulfur cluster assembly accessory protein [Cyanobacteria bacterium J06623_7]